MSIDNKIVKVRRNLAGDITDVMLENGNVFPLNQAILMTKRGIIDGFNVIRGKDGGEYLKPDPNVPEVDDLEDLPKFN